MSVLVEQTGYVRTIILHRPDARNAIDRPTAEQLSKAFLDFENDDHSRVAVLFGEGGNFCAGADLKAIAHGNANRIAEDGDGPLGPTRMLLKKPVIAAISGFAVAGGLELALWCDLRVAEENATLGVFCRRFGVPLVDGGTVRLPRLIGLSHALDLILTGRAVGAVEALRMGLVNRLVPTGHARQEAEALARSIAHAPQDCLRHDRASTYEQDALSLENALHNEFRHGIQSLSSEEFSEGVLRFIQGAGRSGQSV